MAGEVILECPSDSKISQQNGFIHAGAIASIADSACGFAGLTLMPEKSDVLAVEFKINFLKPAKTPKIVAIGKVLQSGRKLTIAEAHVYDESRSNLIAKMTNTLIRIENQ
jgi:uncharacterized protein (TIGR00369 family)